MDDQSPQLPGLFAVSPTEVLDRSPRTGTATTSAPAAVASGWAAVALVEGSGPHLSAETQALLRRRLRLAAVVLLAGFSVFLVKHYIDADFSRPFEVFLLVCHAVTVTVLAAVTAILCRRCQRPLWQLRAAEAAVFGLPVAFFLAVQYYLTSTFCARGHLEFPVGIWLLLIYTYALFVPNTLRRASVVIASLTALPIGLLLLMIWSNSDVASVVTSRELTWIVLMLAVAAGSSVFGVDTIVTLRREAFVARQVGQYRLTRRIGAGGMGEVYLAEHQLLKRPCVIKLIRPEKTGDPNVLARFQREVRATARLSHWNTVEIFDYGSTEDGTFYYVMEYLPGMSLAELVERYGPMPPERVVHLLRQVCDALAEAHAMGLIHRDIKPGNIFAAQRGGVYDVAKLLDFGLVKPMLEEQSLQLTAEGSIAGSPLFMSPEQALGEIRPDVRSDIYSLGAVGYYLLTGRPPFVADKPIKVLFAHAHEQAAPPSQLRPDVPADLEQVIMRCLAKSPADRFQDAVSLGQALAECQSADGWTRAQAAQWWQSQEQEVPVS